ncbi:hypothetical protein JFU47_06515 [Pseudomonas sp. TH39(2020)]|uniref:hypothetical protein n=1 Tax=Pseudomonas sp. TH39(2020) TaxID=2796349 RepID=UPI001913A647|nr:hypothetical protein [Pseudomonas sp. TH39(2020)]MBK5396373.1 hypothetical protein [Pseudomonas sp. TH39(2020)]
MNAVAYPAWVRELYESEIFGEKLALELIKLAKSKRDEYHFGTLLQLETETKARLRPFLAKYGISLSENIEPGDIESIVSAYQATHNLQEFSAVIKPAVEAFLSRFEEIARICPEEDRDVAESMVRHESAILKWLAMESEGQSEGSLDEMIVELRYPLPKP